MHEVQCYKMQSIRIFHGQGIGPMGRGGFGENYVKKVGWVESSKGRVG